MKISPDILFHQNDRFIAEIKRYLQYSDSAADSGIDQLILECIDEMKKISTPHYLISIFPVHFDAHVGGFVLENTNLQIISHDLTRFLQGSEQIVLFACTLGVAIDRRIKQYSLSDITRALVFDATASAMVELVCDYAENTLREELAQTSRFLSLRYSPGYGDLSIDLQPKLLHILDAAKTIGLQCNSSLQLIPSKSVTAVLGINSTNPYPNSYQSKDTDNSQPISQSCAKCLQFNRCYYRKKGETCELQRRLKTNN
jgi:hypothetical protein